MKQKLFYYFVLTFLVSGFGCSTAKKTGGSSAPLSPTEAIVQSVKNKYAPDSRLAIFDVTATPQGGQVVLTGDVESPEAKKELMDAFTKRAVKPIDRITVLPSEELGDRIWGIVRISVANVRDERGQGAELGTQVMMGHPVKLWKKEGGWYLVQSSDRYLGWMEDDGFVVCTKEQLNEWNSADRLIVTAYEGRIWQEPKAKSLPVSDVAAGALLKKVSREGDWFKVELPDKRTGYLHAEAAADYQEWRKSRQPTAENIELAAMSMLGSPYLWGGTSPKGMDCSGFTKLAYFYNGIQLNRNASHQSRQGKEVPLDAQLSQLKKGDLLFFGSKATENRPARIVHVGIYLSDKKFIHSSGMVKINSLDPKSSILDERRLKSLVQARRILEE